MTGKSGAVSQPGFQYRPDIDGLRGVAIVIAVGFHAGLIFRGGFIAVDMFFVISGFLITSLVTRELASGQFRFSTFWMRRVRRLLPALVVATLATCLLGGLFLLPEDLADLGRCLSLHSVMLANWYFYTTSGYFQAAAAQKPFLHYWSLAVEEQFYLIYPCLLWLGLRRSLLILGLASFVLTTQWVQHDAQAAFYLLPTRTWELLLGAGIAMRPMEIPARLRPLASWTGLLGILAASLLFRDDKLTWPGWATLVPCLLTALMIVAHRPMDTPGARWLCSPWLRHLGVISYSWYLWHWPMIAFYRYWRLESVPVWVRLVWFFAGYLLARISYRYVETPFRKPNPRFGPYKVVAVAILIQLGFLALGRWMQISGGLPQRIPARLQPLLERGRAPWLGYQLTLEQARRGELFRLGKEGPVRLWVWGDSQASALIPVLEQIAQENRCRILVATHSGATPLLDYLPPDQGELGDSLPAWNQAVVKELKRRPPETVLLVARWNYKLAPNWSDSLNKTVQTVQGAGSRCCILLETPVYPCDPRKALVRKAILGSPQDYGLTRSQFEQQLTPVRAAVKALAGLEVLDPTEAFFANRAQAILEKDGYSCYYDDTHLSPTGASLLKPLLSSLLRHQRPAPGLQLL